MLWSICRLQKEEPLHAPRLFECSNQTGRFQMEEVYDFTQTDLDEEDIMLLDTWEEVSSSPSLKPSSWRSCLLRFSVERKGRPASEV